MMYVSENRGTQQNCNVHRKPDHEAVALGGLFSLEHHTTYHTQSLDIDHILYSGFGSHLQDHICLLSHIWINDIWINYGILLLTLQTIHIHTHIIH